MDKYELSEALREIKFEYEAVGPDKKDPESGLHIEVSNGDFSITEWTLTEPPDDEDFKKDWEENPTVRVDTGSSLEELFREDSLHRRAYGGDMGNILEELLAMKPKEQKKTIIETAISYIAYHGGSESYVESVGD